MTSTHSPPPRLNVGELLRPPVERRLRRLPRLLARAFGLAWRAAPRELVISTLLQLAAGGGLAVQLLVGRRLLAGILGQGQDPGATFEAVAPDLVILAGVGALVSFANLARGELQRLLSELVGLYSTSQVLGVAGKVELIAFEHPQFSDRLQRAQVNAQIRPTQVANGLLGLLAGLFAVVGIGIALLAISPWFVLFVAVAYVPSSLASNRGSRLLHDFAVDQTERDRRRSYLFNVLSRRDEAAEVRSFGLATFLRRQHHCLYDQRITALRAVIRRRLRLALGGQVLTSLLTAGVVAVLVWMVTTGRMPVAAAGAAAAAVVLLGSRLGSLMSSAGTLYEASLFLEDFTGFIDALPADCSAPSSTVQAPDRFSTLVVKGVTFSYPSRSQPSVRDVSMEIRSGEVVALVGENGSGKTTMAKLLAGLYTPDSGSVTWDGLDVASCDPDRLRSSVAVIFQDFVKYHLSAGDNIALGRHERHDDVEGIEVAARQTGAHGFLSALARGYDTTLGPEFRGGTDLSGGQWQRMALARAFFRDAPFVILDEPTAALDPRAERELFEGIHHLFSGRSVLLISHRFATVRSADRIYVMQAGGVVEHGNHAELMAGGGLYAEMFTFQAAAFLDPA